MSMSNQAQRVWRRSFFLRAIAFRYLLTPIGTTRMRYNMDAGYLDYTDVYVFGIRVARIHR